MNITLQRGFALLLLVVFLSFEKSDFIPKIMAIGNSKTIINSISIIISIIVSSFSLLLLLNL